MLDGLLDIAGGQLFIERSGGQGGKLTVGSEAQGDELGLGEFWNTRTQGGIEQGREAQTLFQPDHAVLHFKGVEATLGDCDDGGKHDDDEPRGMDSGVANQMVDRSYQGDGEDG